MKIVFPDFSLVLLLGPSGAGKSTFATKHFNATEVVSSDFCRGLVSDDENNQSATIAAFEVLHLIVRKRLEAHKLTVVDATNVLARSRKPLLAMAKEFHCASVAVVLNISETICQKRNLERSDRNIPPLKITQQWEQMRRSIPLLKSEGFERIYILSSPKEVDETIIQR